MLIGSTELAERALTDVALRYSKHDGGGSDEYLESLRLLCSIHKIRGDYEAGLHVAKECLVATEKKHGKQSIHYGVDCINVGLMQTEVNKAAEAKVSFEVGLGVIGSRPELRQATAAVLLAHAKALTLSREFKNADSAMARAEKAILENGGQNSPLYYDYLQLQAEIRLGLGDKQNARATLLLVTSNTNPQFRNTCNFARCLEMLAELYAAEMDFEKCEECILEAVCTREKVHKRDSPLLQRSLLNSVKLLKESGKIASAKKIEQRLAEISR